jgi:hypothetical protein
MEGKRQRALVSSTVYESFLMTRFSLLSFFHVLFCVDIKSRRIILTMICLLMPFTFETPCIKIQDWVPSTLSDPPMSPRIRYCVRCI